MIQNLNFYCLKLCVLNYDFVNAKVWQQQAFFLREHFNTLELLKLLSAFI